MLTLEVRIVQWPKSYKGGVDPKQEYVLKFSVHNPGHQQEEIFVWRARSHEKAQDWLMHLPNILTANKFECNHALLTLHGPDVELRELRYLVAEKLQPLTEITDCMVFAKAYCDILACRCFFTCFET